MKKLFCILFFFTIFSPLFSLSIEIPSETSQGDFITIYFYGESKLTLASVELLAPSGAVSQKVLGFPVDKEQKTFVAIIGIPTWSATGTWKVKASAIEAKTKVESEKPLAIKKTTFTEYTLRLNESNTNLVTQVDPKKQEESKVLNEILTNINLEAEAFAEKFIKPTTSTRMTSEFAEKRTLVYNTGRTGSENHWGVDFGLASDSDVFCPADGTVVFADDRIVTGGSLIIEHAPGVYSIFYHLNKNLTKPGDKVKQGEIVAKSGSTGYSTGPHLHWEFRINSIPVSPFTTLERPLYQLKQ